MSPFPDSLPPLIPSYSTLPLLISLGQDCDPALAVRQFNLFYTKDQGTFIRCLNPLIQLSLGHGTASYVGECKLGQEAFALDSYIYCKAERVSTLQWNGISHDTRISEWSGCKR